MGPEPIWGSTSNVPFLGRCRAPGELSQFLKWVAFITVMNALQPNDMGADAVLANDSLALPRRNHDPHNQKNIHNTRENHAAGQIRDPPVLTYPRLHAP